MISGLQIGPHLQSGDNNPAPVYILYNLTMYYYSIFGPV
jgi:hypothetical protein